MNIYSIILLFVLAILLLLLRYIEKKQKKDQLSRIFIIDILLMILQCLCVFIQSLLEGHTNIENIFKIEYITYIANAFMPIAWLFTGLIFSNTKINFKKRYILLFVMPVISLLILWTNKYHNLFYVNYSMNYSEIVYGFYLQYIYTLYTYLFLLLGVFYLLRYSIKNAGFFSRQSLLFIFGSMIPIVVNILGTFNIIPMTVYITPISFAFTIICFTFAIFKFKFLSVTPIAMQRIVDRMSDSFLVVNEDGTITDFNDTFLKTFKLSSSLVRNANFINSNPSNRNFTIKGFHGNNSCQLSINAHGPIFLKYGIEL